MLNLGLKLHTSKSNKYLKSFKTLSIVPVFTVKHAFLNQSRDLLLLSLRHFAIVFFSFQSFALHSISKNNFMIFYVEIMRKFSFQIHSYKNRISIQLFFVRLRSSSPPFFVSTFHLVYISLLTFPFLFLKSIKFTFLLHDFYVV